MSFRGELNYDYVLRVSRSRLRDVFKKSYLMREKYRSTRRSIEESAKLSEFSRLLASSYLEVVEWDKWRRVLRIRV